ncbi:ATP-binding protein [Geomonas sp. Red32]|uniref:ATP-binding protein n=1 Tax=Geomonas sp. Red32 TaxID=2912856 RepID=UPI00202CADD9|nr:ATP-binding protein [Geomonas sp. Red32]MCM0083058.1 ATP-binding protein [Geomonas sp. Red32]
MNMTLEKRIFLFSFLILFLTIFASSGMDIMALRKDQIQNLNLRSQSLAGTLAANIEKVLNLGLELKDMSGLSEKCREIIEGNPDIAYSLVTDLNGNVIFASSRPFFSFPKRPWVPDNPSASPSDAVVEQIPVPLDGRKEVFYDSSLPVKSPYGKPIARVHVGFSEDVVFERIRGMVYKTLYLLALALLASFTFVMIFVKRAVTHPISILLKGVKQISQGSFDTKITEVGAFEFAELGKSINIMSESLKARDAELNKSYQEMERTFEELQASYQKLETLSAELERSEELYKSLMEDASDAIVVIDADESIRMVNKMAEDFFGYESKEVVGLPLTKLLLLLNIANIPKVQRMFREAAGGNHVADEMQLSRKEGGAVVALLHASSVKSGNETLVQAIFRDVTREREIIANLEKSSADLARLNRMKDSFLGLASHELKTPLTVIMGYSELITTDLAETVDKTVLEMVANIANAASRLDNIIKDMVDVSMIDEKRLQLKMEEVHLNRLIESSVNELRFFFSMRKQEVVLRLDESIPTIRGDALRLMQLLSNILGNAIKFTPDGGRITVSTSAKYLLRSSPGSDPLAPPREHHLFLEITVTDTGIGIDREDQVRIFEKFYEVGNIQEHSSGKVAFKAKGAGLGLSIAKGVVDMHGGEIWVESTGYDPESFPGSTFHILLPVTTGLAQEPPRYATLLH